MYKDQVTLSAKVGGQVLREEDGAVRLPFGSEYSLHVGNLGAKRIAVHIEIDGKDVLGGSRLIVSAGGHAELEGFLEAGSKHVFGKFRFIERTQRIEEHRGITPSDGLVTIRWKEESQRPSFPDLYPFGICTYHVQTLQPTYMNSETITTTNAVNDTMYLSSNVNYRDVSQPAAPGITVPGSDSSQSFHSTDVYTEGMPEHVMVLQLVGTAQDEPLITTSGKMQCPTCGKKSTSKNKYCPECGTRLWGRKEPA